MSISDRPTGAPPQPDCTPWDSFGGTNGNTGKVFFLARRGLRSLSREGEPFLDYEAEELFLRDMFELVHPGDLARLHANIASIIERPGTSSRIEARFRDINGMWRWVEASVQNVLEGPGDGGLLVVDLRELPETPERPAQASYRDALTGMFPYTP